MENLGKKTSELLDRQRSKLAATILERQLVLQPELSARYTSDEAIAKCQEDIQYHLAYLSAAIAAGSPGLFNDYVAWVKILFLRIRLPWEDFAYNLRITGDVLEETLPAEMKGLIPSYIQAGLEILPPLTNEVHTLPSYLNREDALHELARHYLDALLRGERHTASRLILKAVESGASVKELYLHVFQDAQYELGRLWQLNEISVAQEHYCTAATQMIMSQLYDRIFSTKKKGRWFIGTCVSGELHELGVRMVADFFEMDGWDTLYLGANTPTPSIVQLLNEHRINVLGISATMAFHVNRVMALIEAVRNSKEGEHVKILVGGYPFKLEPELWQKVGADGFAHDAQTAVSLANQLLTR